MPPEFVSDHERHVDIELVGPTVEDTASCSPEVGLSLPATVTDTAQTVNKPPAPPILGTSDTAAGTSPQLPAVLPPTSPILGTSNTTADTTPQLQALPAVLPPTPPILGTSDTAAGTFSQLPVVPPCAEIIDDSHKDGDASIIGTFGGYLSEKSMSWQDWENSFTTFKALLDSGLTILRSIDELLPLCHRFNGYVAFQDALVYLETVVVLRKFMDKYGSFMEIIDITFSFLRTSLSLDTCLLSSCRLSLPGSAIDYLGAWFCSLIGCMDL
ncbi:unnamed protein product [Prunus brigantina]